MSAENMENEKACTRKKNRYFLKNSDINNCFPNIYNNCPKIYFNQKSKIPLKIPKKLKSHIKKF